MQRKVRGQTAAALCAGAALLLTFYPTAGTVAQAALKSPGGDTFAVVGEKVITFQAYQSALAAGMRQKYYHARPPERELAEFQREIGEQLVNRVLLLEEAKRRGIEPDRSKVDELIAGYERRYRSSEQWRANREKMLPGLIEQLEHQSVLERLEREVRAVGKAREDQVRGYYETHRDLFTEPEQVRLSLILLKVDPSSPRVVWEKASEEAERLYRRLQQGADFGELARMHSADPSAARGGDLGYVHRGMLPDQVQNQLIDTLKPGVSSRPVALLEGVAIMRLEDRKPARLRAFAGVRRRAEELWARDQGEQAWSRLIAELRSGTEIRIDESRFIPISSH